MNYNEIKIGILGSGQLGRMISIAASRLGIRSHIYAPDAKNSPAADVSSFYTNASYTNEASLKQFANSVDVITCEFENVPFQTINYLSNYKLVSPGNDALKTSQNRILEKKLAQSLNIPVPKYWVIRSKKELELAQNELNHEGVLKTTTQGYDGKGQKTITKKDNPSIIWNNFTSKEAILEEKIKFSSEASFLIWRYKNGKKGFFPPTTNEHVNGILYRSKSPTNLSKETILTGKKYAYKIADKLNLIGLLALETFILNDELVIFNEIAPRPHNSYHWTIEGCKTSQFEQLIRTILNIPEGTVETNGNFCMQNILGEDFIKVKKYFLTKKYFIHLYGKSEIKKGRKMGHITWKDI